MKNQLINPNSMRSNDILVNLIIGVDFLGLVCPKSWIVIQALPLSLYNYSTNNWRVLWNFFSFFHFFIFLFFCCIK